MVTLFPLHGARVDCNVRTPDDPDQSPLWHPIATDGFNQDNGGESQYRALSGNPPYPVEVLFFNGYPDRNVSLVVDDQGQGLAPGHGAILKLFHGEEFAVSIGSGLPRNESEPGSPA